MDCHIAIIRIIVTCTESEARWKTFAPQCGFGNVCPARIQISLHICTIWSKSSLIDFDSQGCNVSPCGQWRLRSADLIFVLAHISECTFSDFTAHFISRSHHTLRWQAYSIILKISPPKTESFQIKKNSDILSYFCSKHRLWVFVRTAWSRRF